MKSSIDLTQTEVKRVYLKDFQNKNNAFTPKDSNSSLSPAMDKYIKEIT